MKGGGAVKIRSYGRDYTLVVVGQIVSLFGNAILRFSLPLYLLWETHPGHWRGNGFNGDCDIFEKITQEIRRKQR